MKTIINPRYSYSKSIVEIADLDCSFSDQKGTWTYFHLLTLFEREHYNAISKEEWIRRNPSMGHLVDETISKEEWNQTKRDYLHIDDFWSLEKQKTLMDLYNKGKLIPFLRVESICRGEYLGGTFDKGVAMGGGGTHELILNGNPLPDYLKGYVKDWDMSSPSRFHIELKSPYAKGHYVYSQSINETYKGNYSLIVSDLL